MPSFHRLESRKHKPLIYGSLCFIVYSDFVQKEKELDSQHLCIRLDKYVMKKDCKKYDMYTFRPLNTGNFISKELRNVIVDNNLTGLKIIEID